MVDAVGTGALLAADSGPELPTVNDFLPPEILFQEPLRDQSHHIDPHRGDRGASRGARYHGEARQAHPRPLARRGRDGHRLRARQRRISGHGRAARQALRADDFDVVLHDLCVQPVRHHPRHEHGGHRHSGHAAGVRGLGAHPVLDHRSTREGPVGLHPRRVLPQRECRGRCTSCWRRSSCASWC